MDDYNNNKLNTFFNNNSNEEEVDYLDELNNKFNSVKALGEDIKDTAECVVRSNYYGINTKEEVIDDIENIKNAMLRISEELSEIKDLLDKAYPIKN